MNQSLPSSLVSIVVLYQGCNDFSFQHPISKVTQKSNYNGDHRYFSMADKSHREARDKINKAQASTPRAIT